MPIKVQGFRVYEKGEYNDIPYTEIQLVGDEKEIRTLIRILMVDASVLTALSPRDEGSWAEVPNAPEEPLKITLEYTPPVEVHDPAAAEAFDAEDTEEADASDVEAAKEALADPRRVSLEEVLKKTRRRRSDAGVPRGKK